MPLQFTANGVDIQTLQEVTQELSDEYRSIYGQDIDLSPESPDGQRVGIEAKARHDLQLAILRLYNEFDPDTASDDMLKRIMKYAGVTIRPATKSQADVNVTVDRPVTLAEDFTVEDENGQQWVIGQSQSLTEGTTLVTFFAEEFGEINAAAGEINSIVTVIPGVTGVNNPNPADPGKEGETDPEARIRRRRSVQLPALTPVGAIFAELADLTDVTDLVIYENDSDVQDTERDIAPHTIWAVIEGGDIVDIAESMAKKKTSGTGTKGDVEGVFVETVELSNGDTTNINHRMRFDRPNETAIEVEVEAVRTDSSEPINTGAIADEIGKESPFGINEDIAATSLYKAGYRAGDNYFLRNLNIRRVGGTFTDEFLDADYDEKFTLDSADVNVIEVTP